MKKLIIAFLILAALSGVAFSSPQQEFIDRMGPVAQEICPQYGIPPSAFLGMCALESGWGRSWLAVYANNYFGRKCLDLPCIEIKTPEYRRGQKMIEAHSFQIYNSIEDAVHGYCQQFFRKYQSGAYVYPNLDPVNVERFIRSIAPQYATDPNYAEKVLAIIREWNLESWDVRPSQNESAAK